MRTLHTNKTGLVLMKQKQSLNDKNTDKTLAKTLEMQSTINQWCDLRQQGKYDEAAELWAKSQKKDGVLNKEITDRLKNINQPLLANSKYHKIAQILGITLIIFLLGGIVLEETVGKKFIFAWSNSYRDLKTPIFFVLLPIAAIFHFHFLRKDPYISKRYPTSAFRWIILFPFVTLILAIVPLIAPLGWFALSGWAMGSYAENMEAKITSVSPYHYSKRYHCGQNVELEFRGNNARICIDGITIGNTPKPNEKVLIAGQVSWLGIYIQQIKTQSK